jgi:hypothetical protein
MRDAVKNVLSVGDDVVFIPQGGYTSSLERGKVIGFTKQKVRIRSMKTAYSYADDECLKFPEQVVKVLLTSSLNDGTIQT